MTRTSTTQAIPAALRAPVPVTWLCARCAKRQETVAGSGMRLVQGLRQRVCPPCKEKR